MSQYKSKVKEASLLWKPSLHKKEVEFERVKQLLYKELITSTLSATFHSRKTQEACEFKFLKILVNL